MASRLLAFMFGTVVAAALSAPGLSGRELPTDDGLVPFNDAWVYAPILGFRPGDGVEADVNPPRLSWPYLPHIIAEDVQRIEPTVFTLQLSRDARFNNAEVEVLDTAVNFYNGLAPLDAGRWYWRVGYGKAPNQEWSAPRSFIVQEDTPRWDRSLINQAASLLAQRPRPRLGPKDGDWAAYDRRIRENRQTADWRQRMMRDAERILNQPWWNDFPETDNLGRRPANRNESTRWVRMLKELTVVAYAYRLTGEERFAGSLERIVKMAGWPPGGLLSPENLGGHTKMPSQAPELFAVVYDMFRDDLAEADRETLREAIRWRLQDMYFAPDALIWQNGPDRMRHWGLAYVAGSHPYQNFTWTVPAILLMAGELEIADQLVPLALHYLTGVTIPEGPEEGYNEGPGYTNEKAGTLMQALLVTDLVLPELELRRNPMLHRLAEWFTFLFSGPERLPWGDSWLETTRGVGAENLRLLTYVTGSPLAKTIWQERLGGTMGGYDGGMYGRPWYDIAGALHYTSRIQEIGRKEPEAKLFLPEAGWVFAHSKPIVTVADFEQAIGMQFQMRPRGGYSHSYASDGSFVWFAHGQTLTGGGGWLTIDSRFSKETLSHNSLLIDGEGQALVNPYQPDQPFMARPLAFEAREGAVYWAGELTRAYAHLGGVERVIRHVVFVDDLWFAIYDDIQLSEERSPATFHWLFHIHPPAPLTIQREGLARFSYRLGGVEAQVTFINPAATLSFEHVEGSEAYRAPVSGRNFLRGDLDAIRTRGMINLDTPHQAHALRISNAAPARAFQFFAALTAHRAGEPALRVAAPGGRLVRVTYPDGRERTVSFDPNIEADVMVNPGKVVEHARETVAEGGWGR